MTLLLTGLGMLMMVTQNGGSLILFLCILFLIILLFRIVGSVRLRKTIEGLRQRYVITRQMKEEISNFQDALLFFDKATTFDQWWQAICTGAQHMDFVWLSIGFTDSDGVVQTHIWRRADEKLDLANVAIVTLPIRNPKNTEPIELEMAITVDNSLESVGRRAALFNRLIDEYDIVSLKKGT
jgi:hypothetical protein